MVLFKKQYICIFSKSINLIEYWVSLIKNLKVTLSFKNSDQAACLVRLKSSYNFVTQFLKIT